MVGPRPGGFAGHGGDVWFFSTEESHCGSSHLQPSGRFAHDRAYAERLARAHGFRIATSYQVPVRMETKRWIDGELFILAIGDEG